MLRLPVLRSASLALVLAFPALPSPAQAALPSGFIDQIVAVGISAPSALAFLPDGRALVAELVSGRIRMIRNGTLSTVTTVPNVRTGFERGLLGIAVDPAWPARPYVYVHSTWNQAFEIRISRFTASGDLDHTTDGSLTIDPASRYEVITGIPDGAGNHNGGTVRFGPDGMLYVSLGEDGAPCAAPDRTLLMGKILRLDVDALPPGPGGPPPLADITPVDNPFVAAVSPNERLVWAYGLRNPFRFSIDPSNGRLYIGDVGQNDWEELSEVGAGGQDLGWPYFEGFVPYDDCGNPPLATLAPIHVYDHSRGSAAIIAGPVVRDVVPPGFPADYEGDVFFSEYYEGDLVRLTFNGTSWQVADPVPGQPDPQYWGTGYHFVADWAFAPDGSLWYCDQGSNEVRRIVPPDPSVSVPPGMPFTARNPDAFYDLLGRRVTPPLGNGIYYHRGRKVVVAR